MYIVFDKTSKAVIHRNPAPVQQSLTPHQVYAMFDPNTMEIGAVDGPLPDHFKIENGIIRELTLEELAAQGFFTPAPGFKIKDRRVVEMTISEKIAAGLITLTREQKVTGEGLHERIVEKDTAEKVAEGLITLSPHQKVAGKGSESKILDKSLSEQIRDGLLTLAPGQKITGKGAEERIIDKTIREQVADGTITLQPNQKVTGNNIVLKTGREMLSEGLITLDEYKQQRIRHFSDLSLAQRQAFLPDYKLQNVALGVYDKTKIASIKATVLAFKEEFNRLKELVEHASDANAVDAVSPGYPSRMVE